MSQHTNLAAMMGVMRQHVGLHGCPRRPRFRPTVAVEDLVLRLGKGFRQHVGAAGAAFEQSRRGLFLRTAATLKCRRERQVWCGEPYPFTADVMDMAKDGGDRTTLIPGQLGTPRGRIEMLEDDLIHPL